MILGIDPGLENTGWGIIENGKGVNGFVLVDTGVILTDKKEKSEKRLGKIYEELEKIIKENEISEIAFESLFFARNAKSALKVAEMIGVLKVCGMRNKIPVYEYTPLQVKMALVGYGRAEKEQVEMMVRQTLDLQEEIHPSHASDAVAVALTHGFTMKI